MPAASSSTLGEYAMAYGAAGLPVFPVNPRSKRPLVSQHLATTDSQQIEAWWGRWPAALIGHRVLIEQVILDVDPRHGGMSTWLALVAAGIVDGEPLRKHASGRGDGGFHGWYLRPTLEGRLSAKPLHEWARQHGVGHPVADGKRWTSGIDVLHYDWRYTILPPSPHPLNGMPYRWLLGDPPGPMSDELAALIVRARNVLDLHPEREVDNDDLPGSSVRLADIEHPDSIADWYSAAASWHDLLDPAGWECVAGDGDEDGSLWRHPEATQEHSASIRHGCLFVYSPNTVFEETEDSAPHGYTRFAAFTLLEHEGDGKAAARAARRLRDPDVEGDDEEPAPAPGRGSLFIFEDPPERYEPALTVWHAEALLARPTHGELAGAEKSLKSYTGLALDVAMAAGLPVFGRFAVPERQRVVLLVGEGGRDPWLRRLDAVCRAYGLEMGDLRGWLRFSTASASIVSPRFTESVRAELAEFDPALVHLDPWYAYASDADARQVTEVGSVLAGLGDLCRLYDASLWINHHFNRQGVEGLRGITGAGHAEWVDSWWLVKHRVPADVAGGQYRLQLDVGSRQWGGGRWDLDFDIDPIMGGITWHVEVARDDEDDKGEDEGRQYDEKVAAAMVRMAAAAREAGRPLTRAELIRRTGRKALAIAAFETFVDQGRVIEVGSEKLGNGHSVPTYEVREP